MPRVIITEGAVAGLERCRLFLADKNPHAVLKAAQSIEQKLTILETDPKIGRPLNDFPELRELIIPFGDSGYVSLYHFDENNNLVYVLAFKHQKEGGY